LQGKKNKRIAGSNLLCGRWRWRG